MSESIEQQAVITWFRTQYPDKIIFAIPNGAWLSGDAKRRAMIMRKSKKEGLLPGVSDLFIPVPIMPTNGSWFHGLFIEMKAEGKTWCSVSPVQRQFLEDMVAQGYLAIWAAGFEHAKQIIEDYMNIR